MLVSLTDSGLQAYASSSGADILFTSGDGVTKLNYERETYASSTGALVAWVQIPTLSPTIDTTIYMYYGNASAADQQNAGAAWDTNYKAVWHLPNGSSLTANDSTGTNNATTITATPSAGQVDGAAAFNGSSQVITVPNSSSIQFSGAFSEEAWFYEDSTANYRAIVSKGNDGSRSMSVFLNNGSTNSLYYENVGALSLSSSWSLNTWNHLVLTDDGTNLKAYLNGANVYSNTNGVGAAGNIASLNIGYAAADSNYSYSGKLDEVRISNIVRSAGWIATEYNNQSSPQTFYAVGGLSVQNRPAATPGVAISNRGTSSLGWYNTGGTWTNRRTITIDHSKVSVAASGKVNFPAVTTGTSWTVPVGVTSVTVKAWGAGGGNAGNYNSNDNGGHGGGAGFAKADVTVTPGESLTVLVGGGGGSDADFDEGGGGGGGYSGLKRSSTPLVIAGGGGGGGGGMDDGTDNGGNGGAGGGSTGAAGASDANADAGGGGGGTPSAGGAGGYNGGRQYSGVNGSAYTGGVGQDGGSSYGGTNGGGNAGASGGGGGGYYGGGSGASLNTNLASGGGGGGSSYVTGTNTTNTAGSGTTAANTGNADYPGGGVGNGGSSRGVSGSKGFVTVSYTSTNSSLSNFPMLFSTTDPEFKTVSNGGKVASSTGADILFTANDGTTKLNYEREFYASTTGQLVAWVQIPLLSAASDTTIYMYYGNASATDQQNATAVWDSNYVGVWHLPNGTTLGLKDSTSNANNATLPGGSANPTATTGKIDGGMALAGANSQYLNLPVESALFAGGSLSTFTLEGWMNTTGIYNNALFGATSGSGNEPEMRVVAGNLSILNQGHTSILTVSGAVASNQWTHVAWTYDGGVNSIYVNGFLVGSNTHAIGWSSVSDVYNLGAAIGDSVYSDGAQDESRISNIVRSADWIATEYNDQSAPQYFYSLSGSGTQTRSSGVPLLKVRGGVKFH